jgi:hypothetical protein
MSAFASETRVSGEHLDFRRQTTMNSGWLCALALLSSSAAGSGTLRLQPQDATAASDTDTSLEHRVDVALDELSAQISRGSLDDVDFGPVRAAVREMAGVDEDPRGPVVAARLEQAIDGLEQRAKACTLNAIHVDMLREQLVDLRLDCAVDALQAMVESGTAVPPEIYKVVNEQIVRRAEVARPFDAKSVDLRMRLQAGLDHLAELGKEGQLKSEDIEAFRVLLLEERVQHALANLERRAQAGDLTSAELLRLRGILEDHAARHPEDSEFAALHERFKNALDVLEQRIRAGRVDATEVARLRDTMTRRVREASAKKE